MKCAERNLLEFVQQPDKVRVDREKRMIFGLKLAGTESQNSHGEDADGTDYTLNAYRKAKHLYEGAPGYWGHPPRATPNVERSPHEKILTYCDVEVREDGVYGNAKYLESHPHTPLLLEAVEKDPGWFALSHNATGRGPVRNRRYVIEEIGRVKSVDVVCQGATNRTLFESQESDMPTVKFKVIPACFTGKARERYTKLLEADDYMSEVDVPATPEGGGTADEHLSNAAKAIFDDGSLDASQKLAKLKLLLKINDEADAKTDGDEIDKAVAESLAKVEARTEGMLDLFESVGYVPTKVQRKALKGLESSEQKELLESFKAAKAGGRRERGGPGLPLMESKEEKGGEKPTFDKAAAINRFNGSLA
jgi:hypothetical protein